MRWRSLSLILAGAMFVPLLELVAAAPKEPLQFALPAGHDLQFTLPSYVFKAAVRVIDAKGNEQFIFGTRRNPLPITQPTSSGISLCNGSQVTGDGQSTSLCHLWGVYPEFVVWIEMYNSMGKPILIEDSNPSRHKDTRGFAALRCRDDGTAWVCVPLPWQLLEEKP